MSTQKKGFDPAVIEEYRAKMGEKSFLIVDSEDNSDEYVNFFFIGKLDGTEVLFDAVIYTLRLSHESEIFEIAEHEAAKRFPNFRKIKYDEDENGNLNKLDEEEEEIGLFMAEVIMELEDESGVKVKERLELDEGLTFGVGLDVALNVSHITDNVISEFIEKYNSGSLRLDPTYYSFKTEDPELA